MHALLFYVRFEDLTPLDWVEWLEEFFFEKVILKKKSVDNSFYIKHHFHASDKFCCYPQTKSEGYSFGVIRPSVRTFCLSRTISQYLVVRFNLFLVQMISTMDSRYLISLVKIDPLTLELLPLFKYRQL